MTTDHLHRLCLALSHRLSLSPIHPRILGRFSNLVVALDPHPYVARIATGTALLRDTAAFAAREVEVARFVAASGVPIATPCEPPLAGPHDIEGVTLTLWHLHSLEPAPPNPTESGRRLHRCHQVLRSPNAPRAPRLGPFREIERALAHPWVHEVTTADARNWLRSAAQQCEQRLVSSGAPGQTVHGDAHRKNVLSTAEGPLWADWEDAVEAPIEWDLACLVTPSHITGLDRDWAFAALSAYGAYQPEVLDLCIQARAAFAIAWMWLLSSEDQRRLTRVQPWIDWLQQH